MQPGQMAYDRAITVFSPDGRLFQVEYARVAVTRGNTTVGLKFKNGIVLMADKKLGSRLVETASIEKIFQIDDHVGAATSGLVADARVLVDYARLVAQINKVTYSEKIGVDLLVKRICDYKQNYTQYGGVRPFGTALLVAGVDDLGKIVQIDDHVGAATSGLVADARVLVDYARLVAQINKVTYSEKIGVDLLVKRICDYKQNYTQYGGVRPFGTALLVAGVDDLGTHLF